MTKPIDKIKAILAEVNLIGKAEFNFRLSGISSINAGGRCTCFLKIDRRSDLFLLVKKLALNDSITCYPVGDCTNILFNDGNLDILIIRPGVDLNYFNFGKNGKISAGASLNLQKFLVLAADRGYDCSFLAGIPGTVGGAVMGNSGTRVQNINQLVSRINYIYWKGKKVEEREIDLDKYCHSYRFLAVDGLFLLTDIHFKKVLSHPVKISTAGACSDSAIAARKLYSRDEILENIRKNIKIKKDSQPIDSKSAGCFFKNPQNCAKSAGEIIENCRFKGFRFGNARVSEKHANFIINEGNASAKDIFILSKIIRERVFENYKINLEYEVKLVGF